MRLLISNTALLLFSVTCFSLETSCIESHSRGGWSSRSNREEKFEERVLKRTKIDTDELSSTPSKLHPLDPLTEAEIEATVAITRRFRREKWVFNYITLKEPEKSLLLPYFLQDKTPPKGLIPRRSFSVLYNRETQRTYEAVVNLDKRVVEKWEHVPGVEPAITLDEANEGVRAVREDPEVIERSRKLGYPDMSLVVGDPWTIGYVGDRPEYKGRRLMQLYLFGKNFEGDNEYAHPFDFLPVVDLNEGRVIAIEELPTHDDFDASNKKGNTVPRTSSNYDPEFRDPNSYREDLRPVNISQPDGVSYTIKGNEISWQKFKMRIGINGREGLVIHHVNYKDGSNVRPLFYRMSLAEMFIPYGDPRPPYNRKVVFDEGAYGTGNYMLELQPQRDCIGEVHFFDGVLHNEKGEPIRMPRMVCVNEEDAGILWKHTDFRTGRNNVVRSQRLALTAIASLGNYDYIFTWYFYLDGTIEFIVKLSGIVNTNLLAVNATPAGHGTIVFPQINAHYHQHFFNMRLDPEIDGTKNTVAVSDVVPLPAASGSWRNPYGQGFTARTTVLRTAATAKTNISPHTSRTWHIRNSNKMNPYTKGPVAWKLMPWTGPPTMLKRDSPYHDQVEYLDFDTWVTPYEEDQLFPAGYYLNGGLSEWAGGVNAHANVENTDIVLWYNMGISHIPRTEDFPIMPVETCGFMLKPFNFFKENPALDVPPPESDLGRDEL